MKESHKCFCCCTVILGQIELCQMLSGPIYLQGESIHSLCLALSSHNFSGEGFLHAYLCRCFFRKYNVRSLYLPLHPYLLSLFSINCLQSLSSPEPRNLFLVTKKLSLLLSFKVFFSEVLPVWYTRHNKRTLNNGWSLGKNKLQDYQITIYFDHFRTFSRDTQYRINHMMEIKGKDKGKLHTKKILVDISKIILLFLQRIYTC